MKTFRTFVRSHWSIPAGVLSLLVVSIWLGTLGSSAGSGSGQDQAFPTNPNLPPCQSPSLWSSPLVETPAPVDASISGQNVCDGSNWGTWLPIKKQPPPSGGIAAD